uniref:Uncharacterized protein n=1 Tax=Aegilops tauschii subsp. strangulata TaxID=200361 RepID=A0A453FLH4_AEGTS
QSTEAAEPSYPFPSLARTGTTLRSESPRESRPRLA